MDYDKISQAAEEAYKRGWCKVADDEKERLSHMFFEGVQFAQRWIPVEEELPVINGYVLTVRKRKGISYLHINRIRNGKWGIVIPDTSEITHWKYIELP